MDFLSKNARLNRDEQDFMLRFRQYLKSVPIDVLNSTMNDYPEHEWRIIVMKKSGLYMPERICETINEYDKRKAEEKKLLPFRGFIREYTGDLTIIDKFSYLRFAEWCYENGFEFGSISSSEFKNIVTDLLHKKYEVDDLFITNL